MGFLAKPGAEWYLAKPGADLCLVELANIITEPSSTQPINSHTIVLLYNMVMAKQKSYPYEKIRKLRGRGYTYSEIQEHFGIKIPKSTLSYICRNVTMPKHYKKKIDDMNKSNLSKVREKALAANRKKLTDKIASYRESNLHLKKIMSNRDVRLIALAMLYLGEGAKWDGRRAPMLGSSDPMIVNLYISLMQQCYNISKEDMRCRIQHRADQDSDKLMECWSEATGVKKEHFYPCYIDKRTIGKPTKKLNYKGVCAVNCAGTHIQLELAEVADIIYEALKGH